MSFTPYVFFSGNCSEAFNRYQEIFGGELQVMKMDDLPEGEEAPPGSEGMVMHAALTVGGELLMGSDNPGDDFAGPRDMVISVSGEDPAEAKRYFDALAEGGEVSMPLQEVFWSPAFGMVTDRFGTPWMVDCEAPAPAA